MPVPEVEMVTTMVPKAKTNTHLAQEQDRMVTPVPAEEKLSTPPQTGDGNTDRMVTRVPTGEEASTPPQIGDVMPIPEVEMVTMVPEAKTTTHLAQEQDRMVTPVPAEE